MIKSFKSKALKMLWQKNETTLLPGAYLAKIRRMLFRLEYAALVPDDFLGTQWHIHALRGNLKGYWSLTVSGNYRLIFRFEHGHAYDVDYLDYH